MDMKLERPVSLDNLTVFLGLGQILHLSSLEVDA